MKIPHFWKLGRVRDTKIDMNVSNKKLLRVNVVDFYVTVSSFRVTESYSYSEAVLSDVQQELQAGSPFLDLGKVAVFN